MARRAIASGRTRTIVFPSRRAVAYIFISSLSLSLSPPPLPRYTLFLPRNPSRQGRRDLDQRARDLPVAFGLLSSSSFRSRVRLPRRRILTLFPPRITYRVLRLSSRNEGEYTFPTNRPRDISRSVLSRQTNRSRENRAISRAHERREIETRPKRREVIRPTYIARKDRGSLRPNAHRLFLSPLQMCNDRDYSQVTIRCALARIGLIRRYRPTWHSYSPSSVREASRIRRLKMPEL